MIYTLRCKSVFSSIVMLLAVLIQASSQAEAQIVKPFKINGSGTADYIPLVPFVPVHHDATGEATELGRYHGEGFYQLLGFTGPTTAIFDSAEPVVFTAANGDKLAFTYGDVTNGAAQSGQVTLHPVDDTHVYAVWVAEFNPVPSLCTGKFASVIGGSFIMIAVSDPFVLGSSDPTGYSWSGRGTITYSK